ncbi:MAG: NAD(P)/FAD-dependent oxidoreductase [Candidatus Electrothrix sp.]
MTDQENRRKPAKDAQVVIIGAGPAGLTAAHTLLGRNISPIILEKDGEVGGISRTFTYRRYCFDVGGHRFFTNIPETQRLWQSLLGEDLLCVDRLSRIYYRQTLFQYPLSLKNILTTLGIGESLLILLSFIKAKIVPLPREDNFEQWITNRFGTYLYTTFFKSYTEKVWGIPCHEIQSDWARQRINGLSVLSVILYGLFGTRKLKTLTDHFFYPVKGSGMMWQKMAAVNKEAGGKILCNSPVTAIFHANKRIVRVAYRDKRDHIQQQNVSSLISTLPINLLIECMDPVAPEHVRVAAAALKFRSFIQVCLIVAGNELFPDQWLYIHDPEIQVGRIQNYRNWSKAMAPDAWSTPIGMEYFCSQDEELWLMKDEELVALATEELSLLGLTERVVVRDGFVIRRSHAYPVYDSGYDEQLAVVRNYLEKFSNLQTIGRNGMHRYNNMDHSMWAGILAAENILGSSHDVWDFEETCPDVSSQSLPVSKKLRKKLAQSFASNKLTFAAATGLTSGLLFFLITVARLLKGG